MKIAQLIIRFWPAVGGAEEHCLEISKRLVRDGHEVTVYTSDLESEFPWKRLKDAPNKYKGIGIKRFNAIHLPYPILKGLKKDLMKEKYDLIHAYSMPKQYTDVAASYSKKKGVPLVISTVGLHFHENPRKSNFIVRLIRRGLLWVYYKVLGKNDLKQASMIHCFSSDEKKHLVKIGIHSRKIRVIGSGINWKSYQKKYKFPEKNFLLFIGRIDKGKGLKHLIRALKGTREKLIIIGKDFGYREELEQLIKELKLDKRVKFYGYATKEQKIGALQCCKALVLPSKYESFGRVLVEAMACGKPVIASRVGGITDFVTDKEGILVDYGDVEGLRKAIKKPKGNGCEKSKEFDWDTIYKQTKKLYLHCLK